MKTITFEIDPTGHVKIHVEGVKGRSCVDLTKDIEAALGGAVTKKQTADYTKTDEAAVKVNR